MSNINRFLNSNTSGSFSNDGTVNLNVNSVKIAGLLPSMPVMTDNNNTLISTQTISVLSNALTLDAPRLVFNADIGGIQINSDVVGGVGLKPVTIVASDLTLNGASVAVQGSHLFPSMPVMSDSNNNLISTNTISVPSGTLTLGSIPSTTVVKGGVSTMLLNDTVITLNVVGAGPLSVTASDITLNAKSILPQYANVATLSGQTIPINTTTTISFTTGSRSFSSSAITFDSSSFTINESGIYNLTYTDNISVPASGQSDFAITLLQNGIISSDSLNLVDNITSSVNAPVICLNGLIKVTSGDVFTLRFVNRATSTSVLDSNNATITVVKVCAT